jgi:hypothetical protein
MNTKFTSTYKAQAWTTWKVAGQTTGQYKNAGTFTYLRIYGAGHEVPAYTYGELDTRQQWYYAEITWFTRHAQHWPGCPCYVQPDYEQQLHCINIDSEPASHELIWER